MRPHTLNLYEYCANDPVNTWDPTGYQVSLRDLDEEQQQIILDELSKVTGYENGFRTDENGNTVALGLFVDDDGNLQIAEGAVATGGSDLARESLSSFINDYTLSLIRATSGGASDEAIAFAARVQNVNGEDLDVAIDFKDWSEGLIDYGNINSDTYGIGITLFHEWNHVFTGETDPRSWEEVRSTGSVRGPQVDFANGIRAELDLPIRMGYIATLVSADGSANMGFADKKRPNKPIGMINIQYQKAKTKRNLK